ncbi:Penicillin-binding protein 4 precursor [compost metagenome]
MRDKKVNKKSGKAKKVFKIIGWVLLVLMIITIGAGGAIYLTKVKPMVDDARKVAYEKLSSIDDNTFRLFGATEIYDNKGNLLTSSSSNDYKYAKISNVSKYIQDGYISVEDKRFLEHNGLDYKALMRAGIAYIKNKGVVTQGGSTITQQVIKNLLLSQEQVMSRKITEALIAPKLEEKYSKADIMEFYVNSNFYGEGCYGVETASQYYFSKSAKDLTLSEAATLVGVSNNPAAYGPTYNMEKSTEKRNFVLGLMLENGVISQDDYDKAVAESIVLNIKKEEGKKENYLVSFAIHSAVVKQMQLDGFQFKYTFTNNDEYSAYKKQYSNTYSSVNKQIRTGGYKIYTSLDVEKQQLLQNSVDNNLSNFTDKDGLSGKYLMQSGAVSIDNKTGLVEAIVGGRGGTDEFNRGFLAVRQPGSTIKPLVAYAPAFDTGRYYPSLVMKDEAIDNGPKNAGGGYRGNVSVREALARSINTIAYKMLLDLKPSTSLDYLSKMHFSTLAPADNTPVIALGGFTQGVTVFDMAKGLYTLVNQGVYSDNTCLTKLVHNDKVLYSGESEKTRVYTEDTAYMTLDIMKGVINEPFGTGKGLQIDNLTVAGKTGTTDDSKDGWFIGASAYNTVAVWVGYDNPTSINNLMGATYPGSIWKEYMSAVSKGLEDKDFARPSTVVDKNIDYQGNPVDRDTGKKDIFSQLADEKVLAAKAEQEKAILEANANARLESEPQRQANAQSLVSIYENIKILSASDIDSANNAYNNALTAINTLDSLDVKNTLMSRLGVKKAQLDKEKQPWLDQLNAQKQADNERLRAEAKEKELAEAEGKKQAKEELISSARSAISKLTTITDVTDETRYYYYRDAEIAVNKCSSYSEYNSLKNDLNKEKSRLNILIK